MSNDKNLQFISEKIAHLKKAIMYSMTDELIRLPNSIVTALKVDDNGHLWFLCEKPRRWNDGDGLRPFPVSLHFYRKGLMYFLNVSGKAEIVNSTYDDVNGTDKPLLIKMDILNIEYVEPEIMQKSRFQLWMETGFEWVVRHLSFPREQQSVLPQPNGLRHT